VGDVPVNTDRTTPRRPIPVNWYEDRTPAQWATEAQRLRNEATVSAQRSIDSFERCDTDGFMSQWASDTMSRHYRACAELCDDLGMSEHIALFDLDGNLVSTRQVDGKFGWSWLTTDAHVQAGGRRFVNESKAAKAQRRYDALRAKGYTLGTVKARSGVFTRGGNATCLSECIEILKDAKVEVVAADIGPQGPDF
jgi:hypothetical protein